MALPVDICNMALVRLGQPRISSIDPPYTDPDGLPSKLGFFFPLLRDAELREHPWTFAKKRTLLAEDTNAPAFGYDHQFRLPADFIRLTTDRPEGWHIEGRFILTDDEAPLELTYIGNGVDFTDPMFNVALSCKIALAIAEDVTTSTSKKAACDNDYEKAIARAKATNAIEVPAKQPPEDTFITVRC